MREDAGNGGNISKDPKEPMALLNDSKVQITTMWTKNVVRNNEPYGHGLIHMAGSVMRVYESVGLTESVHRKNLPQALGRHYI